MAKDTCKKEKCTLWSLFDGEYCPNFYRNTFYPSGKTDDAFTVDDCAPIRTMLMIQELHGRLIGVQRSNEEQRNAVDQVINVFKIALNKHEESLKLEAG